MNKNNRIDAFQGLRGYAIILIFLSHCTFSTNSYGKSTTTYLGGLGVSLFIMMSGYLLAFQNHESEHLIPIDTLKRRLKRFYPLHIFTFLLAIPLCIKSFSGITIGKKLLSVIANISLLQAWVPSSTVYFSFNAVSWYLSLTVFFIIASVFTLKLIKRIPLKSLPILLIGVFIFEIIWCSLVRGLSISHWLIYILPIIRYFDYFTGGALCIYVVSHKQRSSVLSSCLFLISLISIVVLFLFSINSNSEYFSTSFWFIPSAMLLAATAIGDNHSILIEKMFSNKAIVYLGNISFEFFLFHQLIIRYTSVIFEKVFHYHGMFIYLIAFIASVGVAIIWNKLVIRLKTKK